MNPSVSEPFYASMDQINIEQDMTEDNDSSLTGTIASGVKSEDGRKARRKGTNLYGRPYCPGRPLSMEERTRIIELHMSGMKVNAISKALCISHGCVSKIISRHLTKMIKFCVKHIPFLYY
uniref:Paired domain-containing protein n=1 Tax=Heterorhabditis bacteriophora TaxID=37862 RepID=A0A1I7W7P5_HETBA